MDTVYQPRLTRRLDGSRLAMAVRQSTRRILLAVSAIALMVAAAGPAQADAPPMPAPVLLDESLPLQDRGMPVWRWDDEQGNATLAQLSTERTSRFRPVFGNIAYTAGQHGALWLHYRVHRPRAARNNGWLIEFPLPALDSVIVYQQDEQGRWQSQAAGDTLAVASWPEPARYPFFRLLVPAGQTRDLYVRIQHTTPAMIPIRFETARACRLRLEFEYLAFGVGLGVLLLLIGVSARQGWVYRDTNYAWFSLYALATTFAVAAYSGLAAQFLWNRSPIWADASQGTLSLVGAAAGLFALRKLACLAAHHRPLDEVLRFTGIGGLALAPVYFIVDRYSGMLIAAGVLPLAAILSTWAAWVMWRRRGDVIGLWVLAAFAPLTLAVLLAMARVLGWTRSPGNTPYAVVAALTLGIPLLFVALTIRSRERHSERMREQTLSSQDALTGLLAPHLFQDRLQHVISRYRRDHESAAIVFVELVNYRVILQMHGPAIAEQSLLRCVIKLGRLMRDVDTIGRIGDARFGLVMEGVSSRPAVVDRAARLIAAGLTPLPGLTPEVFLKFHVAADLLDDRVQDAAELTQALGELLAGMSPRTRRPIRFLEPEVTHPMPLESDSNPGEDPASPPRSG